MSEKSVKISFQDTFDVKDVRKKTNLGMDSFASLIGVSRRTVESWEQGVRTPSGSARNLLIIVWKQPELAKKAILSTIEINSYRATNI